MSLSTTRVRGGIVATATAVGLAAPPPAAGSVPRATRQFDHARVSAG